MWTKTFSMKNRPGAPSSLERLAFLQYEYILARFRRFITQGYHHRAPGRIQPLKIKYLNIFMVHLGGRDFPVITTSTMILCDFVFKPFPPLHWDENPMKKEYGLKTNHMKSTEMGGYSRCFFNPLDSQWTYPESSHVNLLWFVAPVAFRFASHSLIRNALHWFLPNRISGHPMNLICPSIAKGGFSRFQNAPGKRGLVRAHFPKKFLAASLSGLVVLRPWWCGEGWSRSWPWFSQILDRY